MTTKDPGLTRDLITLAIAGVLCMGVVRLAETPERPIQAPNVNVNPPGLSP